VNGNGTPVLDGRPPEAIVAALLARLPGYVPGWQPSPGGPSSAVVEIFGRYVRTLGERVNQAPDKNKLAFLDMLGINLLPAQAARAPVVFETMIGTGDGRAPEGTRVGAEVPGRSDPLVFETERMIGLAAAKLAEVVTVWPGKDAYADHTADASGGRPFTLFEPLRSVPHELYLAHGVHFALAGKSVVEIEFDLAERGQDELVIAWEYWDGKAWRGFKPPIGEDRAGESFDATQGLTASGVVRLASDCAETAKAKVGGLEAFWLRGRLTGPLPPDPGRQRPEVERIQVRTVIDRSLPSPACTGGLLPDDAFSNGLKLDLTKTAFPLGRQPGPDTTFYFRNEEAFSKPGAEVTVCFKRHQTPEEKADELGSDYEVEVTKARKLVLDAVRDAGKAVSEAAQSVLELAPDLASPKRAALSGKVNALITALSNLTDMSGVGAVASAADDVAKAMKEVPVDLFYRSGSLVDIVKTFDNMRTAVEAAKKAANAAFPVADWVWAVPFLNLAQSDAWIGQSTRANAGALLVGAATAVLRAGEAVLPLAVRMQQRTDLETAVNNLRNTLNAAGSTAQQIRDRAKAVDDTIKFVVGSHIEFRTESVPDETQTRKHLADARDASAKAASATGSALKSLSEVSSMQTAAAGGVAPPRLPPPRLVWEYWNGDEWRPLVGPSQDDAVNLQKSGQVSFVVRDDWEATQVNEVEGRWMRVRLASGSYGRLRLVSWVDAQSKNVNFFPIIESRPPVLESFFLGYVYRSPRAAPEQCLTYNDFQWADRTDEAESEGMPFEPFVPVSDATPTLYLGFDAPLPANVLGLYLEIEEAAAGVRSPRLAWEHWSGEEWLPVTVDDETESLARPGIVYVVWPGVPAPPSALVVAASGTGVQLLNAREAARFGPGSHVFITQEGRGELATVASQADDSLSLAAPLVEEYARATIALADQPRFGRPRTWLRARLRVDGEPRRARVGSLQPNAVWVAQIETVENELLGSGTEQPNQTVFFSRAPVLPGETVEVRELEGARANVEYPILLERLEQEGVDVREARTVADRVTGRITEVWVPWRERPNFYFSEPTDRDYTIERSRGRLIFGSGDYGRLPLAGTNNIRARRYRRSEGGSGGNVPAGAISQVLSAVVVQGVTNPRGAEGGADGEPERAVLRRGPLIVRHRGQALSLEDFEALAREASPAVAVARALPATHSSGRPLPGWVKVIIAPRTADTEPQPSVELRRLVRDFLVARTPASMAGQIVVVGPAYLPIEVEAVIAPTDPNEAGTIVKTASDATGRFLHPLFGGPEGAGWPFGRDVYLSDLAATLEALGGVDYVERLNLLTDGVPRGERVSVPPDRIVVAGPARVTLAGGEG
jgi:hypothetical protein